MADRPAGVIPTATLHDLQVADARWRSVLDTARDAIICIDVTGAVTLFNRMAEEMFGYAADEVLGRNVAMLMASPYREQHDEYIRRYQRGGAPRAIGRIRSVHGQRKTGERFPIELSVSEARLGDEILYTAVLRDVSDHLALQAAAQERARLADIGAITARIVHDLGNPLAALSMQTQLILRRARRGEFQPVAPVQQPAEQILQTLRRLESLVREFVDFAREQRLKLGRLRVDALLQSCVDLWQVLAASKGIRLNARCAGSLPALHADDVMLRRVLDNLIKNALEAIGSGPGEVAVIAEPVGEDRLSIVVEDDGPGVADGVDVFALFETTKADGTGIGLAVAKQIVEAHGGTIGYAARAPRGTSFRLELPLHGPPGWARDGAVD